MRREPTEGERKRWGILRNRGLGGFKFRRQAPVGGFILDFYCEAASLCVELDGEQHGEAEAVVYDERRARRLGQLRIRVVRYADRDVLRDPVAVARTILRVLSEGGVTRVDARAALEGLKILTPAFSHTHYG